MPSSTDDPRPPRIRVRFVVYQITATHPKIAQRKLQTFDSEDAAKQYAEDYATTNRVPVTVERRVYVDGKLKSVQPDIAVF